MPGNSPGYAYPNHVSLNAPKNRVEAALPVSPSSFLAFVRHGEQLIVNKGLAQVYSFVPIPGAQQHKRPRRRYEEIERMYKCGWNNCEKAYGTLNHLNAHVTMQSHGTKRTPEGMPLLRCFLVLIVVLW